MSAEEFIPNTRDLEKLSNAAQACKGCDLYRFATQAVFGEGSRKARAMFVGEAPGDQEDKQGHPFVGPAGRLLNQIFDELGIDRKQIYVTNAVKHFKFTMSGKRRLHAKPSARETTACRPWLETEIELIQPQLIVCLGATAALSLLGRDFRLTQNRGQVQISRWEIPIIATYHPSALLRAPDPVQRAAKMKEFREDLQVALQWLNAHQASIA